MVQLIHEELLPRMIRLRDSGACAADRPENRQ